MAVEFFWVGDDGVDLIGESHVLCLLCDQVVLAE